MDDEDHAGRPQTRCESPDRQVHVSFERENNARNTTSDDTSGARTLSHPRSHSPRSLRRSLSSGNNTDSDLVGASKGKGRGNVTSLDRHHTDVHDGNSSVGVDRTLSSDTRSGPLSEPGTRSARRSAHRSRAGSAGLLEDASHTSVVLRTQGSNTTERSRYHSMTPSASQANLHPVSVGLRIDRRGDGALYVAEFLDGTIEAPIAGASLFMPENKSYLRMSLRRLFRYIKRAMIETWNSTKLPRTVRTLGFFIVFNLIVLLLWTSLRSELPPVRLYSDGLPLFSAENAYHDLRILSSHPHPAGSDFHLTIQGWLHNKLRALESTSKGRMKTVIDDTMNIEKDGVFFETTNLIARLYGKKHLQHLQQGKPTNESFPSFMLSAHYDSSSTGNGATDAGISVVSMLELIRALLANQPLDNDLILLFNDGEEAGLFGASAFTHHPWFKDVIGFGNLEGAGTAMDLPQLFRSNSHQLLDSYSTVPYPRGNVILQNIMRFIGSNTDYTVYTKAGLPGYDVAFISGRQFYHSTEDNCDHVDPRAIQAFGDNLMASTRSVLQKNLDDGFSYENVAFYDLMSIRFSMSTQTIYLVWCIAIAVVVVAVGGYRAFKRVSTMGISRFLVRHVRPTLEGFIMCWIFLFGSVILVYPFALIKSKFSWASTYIRPWSNFFWILMLVLTWMFALESLWPVIRLKLYFGRVCKQNYAQLPEFEGASNLNSDTQSPASQLSGRSGESSIDASPEGQRLPSSRFSSMSLRSEFDFYSDDDDHYVYDSQGQLIETEENQDRTNVPRSPTYHSDSSPAAINSDPENYGASGGSLTEDDIECSPGSLNDYSLDTENNIVAINGVAGTSEADQLLVNRKARKRGRGGRSGHGSRNISGSVKRKTSITPVTVIYGPTLSLWMPYGLLLFWYVLLVLQIIFLLYGVQFVIYMIPLFVLWNAVAVMSVSLAGSLLARPWSNDPHDIEVIVKTIIAFYCKQCWAPVYALSAFIPTFYMLDIVYFAVNEVPAQMMETLPPYTVDTIFCVLAAFVNISTLAPFSRNITRRLFAMVTFFLFMVSYLYCITPAHMSPELPQRVLFTEMWDISSKAVARTSHVDVLVSPLMKATRWGRENFRKEELDFYCTNNRMMVNGYGICSLADFRPPNIVDHKGHLLGDPNDLISLDVIAVEPSDNSSDHRDIRFRVEGPPFSRACTFSTNLGYFSDVASASVGDNDFQPFATVGKAGYNDQPNLPYESFVPSPVTLEEEKPPNADNQTATDVLEVLGLITHEDLYYPVHSPGQQQTWNGTGTYDFQRYRKRITYKARDYSHENKTTSVGFVLKYVNVTEEDDEVLHNRAVVINDEDHKHSDGLKKKTYLEVDATCFLPATSRNSEAIKLLTTDLHGKGKVIGTKNLLAHKLSRPQLSVLYQQVYKTQKSYDNRLRKRLLDIIDGDPEYPFEDGHRVAHIQRGSQKTLVQYVEHGFSNEYDNDEVLGNIAVSKKKGTTEHFLQINRPSLRWKWLMDTNMGSYTGGLAIYRKFKIEVN